MEPVLSLRGIVKGFSGVLANDGIDLDVYLGEIHALLGENGAGKSTLMNILYGVYSADAGKVLLKGQEVNIDSPKKAIELGIGMVHQHFMLIPTLTVAENIVLGMSKKLYLNKRSVSKQIRDASEQFGLKIDPDAIVSTLSVGQQQRVEILKALYRGAKVLILDEPTAVLTPQEIQELFVIFRRLTTEGVTVIFISHKLNEIMAISHKVSVLRRGKLISTVLTKDTSPEELAGLMVGHKVDFKVHKKPFSPGKLALEINDLYVKNAQERVVINGISLEIHAGEIFGLAGVDGNGQSELICAITGLQRVDSGTIKMLGQEVTNFSPRQLLSLGLAHIPEDRQKQGLVLDMTIKENLILESFYRPPFSKRHFLQKKAIDQVASESIAEFDIRAHSADTHAGKLSGGNQQKIVLARALRGQPNLLIAVHPTRGLDIGATQYVHHCLLKERDRGCAVLFVSTEIDEILSLSDRIGIMYEGRLIGIMEQGQADIKKIGLLMAGREA